MLKKELDKYRIKGVFTFKPTESLQEKCNAPSNYSGIYLIYKVINSTETIMYIGSSGQKVNGMLKTRKSGLGGMKDRIVNGYHPKFGKIKRHRSFPTQMIKDNISELKIYWWVTFANEDIDFPTDVETRLRENYFNQHGRLPDWHKSLNKEFI